MARSELCETIVHIGYHKTATTWLQKRLFPLVQSHVLIPRSLVQKAFLMPSGMHFDPDEARKILRKEQADRPLLLSEENLSGYLHNGGLHGLIGPEMARRIKATFPDANILITIRNQFDICRASYAQYVSGGGTWSQQRYFHTAERVQGALLRPWKAPIFEYEHFEFDRLVGVYEQLFGQERVHVYPYEWLRDPEPFVSRLEQDLGLQFRGRPKGSARSNSSLGSVAQTLLRGANLFTRQSVVNKDHIVNLPGGQVIRHVVKTVLKHMPYINQRVAELQPVIRSKVEQHYPPSNRRLIELRGLPLGELGYPL